MHLQQAHAHRHNDTELLPLADSGKPYDKPREKRQCNIGGTRVNYAHASERKQNPDTSPWELIPAKKTFRRATVSLARHVLKSSPTRHISSNGQHCTQCSVPLAQSVMVTDAMMNHRSHHIAPLVIRSSVMAKEILLKSAARMEQKPAQFEDRRIGSNFSPGMVQACLPNPRLTLMVRNVQVAMRAS